MLSDFRISKALEPYGVRPSALLSDRIRSYIGLLLNWNKKISLTTITDPDEILKLHFGESFFAASVVPIRFGRLADVGSGAGFPGMAIAMIVAELQVTLIESNLKKSAFLSEVVRSLRLPNVSIVRSRVQDVKLGLPRLDFITARALGSVKELLDWSKLSLSESGKVVLWVGSDDAQNISRESAWLWSESARIPGSRRRVLLVGSRKIGK